MYLVADTLPEQRCLAAAFTVEGELLAAYPEGRLELRRGSSTTEVKVLKGVKFSSCALAVPPAGAVGTTALAAADKLWLLDKRYQAITTVGIRSHEVAALCWSPTGSHLLAVHDDGTAKVYSSGGQVECSLSAKAQLLHAAAWGPAEPPQLAYASGRDLAIATLESRTCKVARSWQGHDGIVLSVDWSTVSNRIISGGEDRCYKIWGAHGQLLYSSPLQPHSITAAVWNARGMLAAIGSFNRLCICDAQGILHSEVALETGSVLSLSWHPAACGQLAALGSRGKLATCKLADVTVSSGSWSATLQPDGCSIQLCNVAAAKANAQSMVTCPRDVQHMVLGHGHLVAQAGSQLLVFALAQPATPLAVAARADTVLLLLSERNILTLSASKQIGVHGYDGSHVGAWHVSNLFPICSTCVSLANDYVAFLDAANDKSICFMDLGKVKQNVDSLQHSCSVSMLALSQQGTRILRKVAFVDGNGCLSLQRVTQATGQAVQLHSHVSAVRWHDSKDVLTALAQHQLVIFFCPEAAFGDQQLLQASCCRIPVDQSITSIQEVTASTCMLLHDSGLPHREALPPVPLQVQELAMAQQFSQALQLCYCHQDAAAWAVLGAHALEQGQVEAARDAYAALGLWERMVLLDAGLEGSLKAGEGSLQQRAMLLLGQQEDDEAQLVQSGRIKEATQSCIHRGAWQQALSLAASNPACQQDVRSARQQFLADSQRTSENIVEFQQPLF